MLGLKRSSRGAGRGEAEKPFWISFSDLMTALMVLFLIAMAVALLSVTQGLRDIKAKQEDRTRSVDSCMSDVQDVSKDFHDVTIKEHSIDFGSLAYFAINSSELSKEQEDSTSLCSKGPRCGNSASLQALAKARGSRRIR